MKTFYLIVVLGFLVGFNCNCGTNYTECSIAAQYYCCPGTTCPSTSASCIQPCSNVMCSVKLYLIKCLHIKRMVLSNGAAIADLNVIIPSLIMCVIKIALTLVEIIVEM